MPAKLGSRAIEFQYEPRDAGGPLIVVFSSYGQDGKHGSTALAQPKFEFVRSLEAHDISCLFVMDIQQHWYHSGVNGLGNDIPQVADAIHEYTQRHGRVLGMGHSMGGYAALLFGRLCEFDETVATAPQTSITSEHRVAWRDKRWPKKISEARTKSTTPEYFDLLPTLSEPHRTRHRIVYSGTYGLDIKHAEHVRAAQGVTLEAVESSDHNTARWLRDSGQLEDILVRIASSSKRSD